MRGIPGVGGVVREEEAVLKDPIRDLDVSPQKAKAETNDLAQKR